MNIPENVNNLITKLESAGFEAYAVGGCVRDGLMGKAPSDWDVCASALPTEVKEVFRGFKIVETGIRHGTVTVFCGSEGYEITTFRVDGDYTDNRRPDSVEYTRDIVRDLSRRDFTVNAMAYNPKRGLIDPFGGRRDIEKGIVRAVGDPRKRFEEDALRILRGMRFCACLGFSAEKATAAAMLEKRELIKSISAQRIRSELVKALCGGKIRDVFTEFSDIVGEILPELSLCMGCGQNTPHHCYDVYTHILTAVDNYKGDSAAVKAALLLHDAGKPSCKRTYGGRDHFKGHPAEGVKIAEIAMKRLKFDNFTIERVKTLIRFHDVRLKGSMPQMLKIMRIAGAETLPSLFEVMTADILAQSEYGRAEKLALIEEGRKNYGRAVSEKLCYRLCDLDIDGNDVRALGFRGREIKAALNYALNGVVNGKIQNDAEELKKYLSHEPEVRN